MGREKQIEDSFIRKLTEQLKYVYRDDIHDRNALVANFRQKFETLNRVKLSDSEFDRLEKIIKGSEAGDLSAWKEQVLAGSTIVMIDDTAQAAASEGGEESG